MYRVNRDFIDIQDGNWHYVKDDEYPRSGLTPKQARISELASENNLQGAPLIKLVKEKRL